MSTSLLMSKGMGMFTQASIECLRNLTSGNLQLGEESCSEVSSTSPLTTSSPHSTGISPTLNQSNFNDVDLSFWDLAINSSTSPSSGQNLMPPFSSCEPTVTPKKFSFFIDETTPSLVGRDDLSPASSINSFCADGTEKRKKNAAAGRQTEELCLVCGDRASGYHYNALTCEGCKGFFRRSITKKAVYTCKYGKNCEMDMYMRRKCQECRFKKCINVGMRPECVVPEQTCELKRKQKEAKEKDKNPKQDLSKPTTQTFLLQLDSGFSSTMTLPSGLKTSGRIVLDRERQELISRLINNQEEFESPSELELKKSFAESHHFTNPDQYRYHQITEMTRITVELIVQFALRLPGFATIPVEDQVTLLKACSSELIILRASRRYHTPTDTIVFADNSPCTREFYRTAGMEPDTVNSLFSFCKKMALMKVDNAEYALLSGIIMFSERPALVEPLKVERIQILYVETLYAYVINKWAPKSGMMVAKLLDVLTQLRSLSSKNNEQAEEFITNDKKLPDLLAEIWDISKKNAT